MDAKATTKFRYRIEPKPGGGFFARAEEGSTETLEGATQEELRQKIEDKFTAVVEEMLRNNDLTKIVGEMLHDPQKTRSAELQIGGAQVRVNVNSKSSATSLFRSSTTSAGDLAVTPSAEPRFESSNKLWLVIALSMALGAALMYLLNAMSLATKWLVTQQYSSTREIAGHQRAPKASKRHLDDHSQHKIIAPRSEPLLVENATD